MIGSTVTSRPQTATETEPSCQVSTRLTGGLCHDATPRGSTPDWLGAPAHWTVDAIAYSYDASNNAINYVGNHLYLQGSACLVLCALLTLQGSSIIASLSGFSFTRWFSSAPGEPVRFNKGSLFLGLSIGVNSATPQEPVQNNTVTGGCVVVEIGGCAGASGNVTGSGLGPVRPYAGVAAGDGFQVEGERSYSYDVAQGINNFFAQYVGW
jgi:hypothetical protein